MVAESCDSNFLRKSLNVGLPVVTVPVWPGEPGRGLPMGVQVIAAPWREDLALRVAAQLERDGVVSSPVAA